jgi:hypothetical protein
VGHRGGQPAGGGAGRAGARRPAGRGRAARLPAGAAGRAGVGGAPQPAGARGERQRGGPAAGAGSGPVPRGGALHRPPRPWAHPGAPGADAIYNGAVDNASGVAAMLEIARAFARYRPAGAQRFFAAVAAEEQGTWDRTAGATRGAGGPAGGGGQPGRHERLRADRRRGAGRQGPPPWTGRGGGGRWRGELVRPRPPDTALPLRPLPVRQGGRRGYVGPGRLPGATGRRAGPAQAWKAHTSPRVARQYDLSWGGRPLLFLGPGWPSARAQPGVRAGTGRKAAVGRPRGCLRASAGRPWGDRLG